MQAHDLDAPYLDTPHGRSRLFLEDDPPISVEDGPPTSVKYDTSTPSVTEWASSASAIFLFLFLVVTGVSVALAWRLTDMHKPTVPPEGFAELQQQLKSIAADLSAVRHTLDQQSAAINQQSAANHDQLTRIQEQISQQSIALLSAVSTQDSSKSRQVAPPLPPKR